MLSDEEAQEFDDAMKRLRRVLGEIHSWPQDDARYCRLLTELRELQRLLNDKLQPATETLPP